MFRSEGTPRWRAAIASIAGAALLTLGAGSAALAAPIVDQEEGTLTIHKYSTDAADGSTNDGLPKDGLSPEEAIEGVEYKIQQVEGIDLSTNQGWQDAAALFDSIGSNPAENAFVDPNTLGAEFEETTGPDGIAFFDSLPIGLYYVTETSTPAGVVAGAPFLITVPITHPVDTNEWIYDVHVYPKNSIVGGEKEVEDADGVQTGDAISYTIRGDIPNAAVTDAYRIVDNLPEELELNEDSIVVSIGEGDALVPLGAGDYILTPLENGFQIDLTESGREAAYAAVVEDAKAQVVVQFDAVVLEAGEITNEAQIFPNQPSIDNETPVEPEVETKWGGITLNKVDSSTGEGLEDAVFEVWYSNTDDFETAEAVLDGAENRTWTTDDNGQVVIDGLRYSDFANGEAVAPGDDEYRYYWLVEVQAAEGYELLAEPIGFLVNGQAVDVEVEVKNVPHNAGFELPLTGGTGTVMFTVLGLALLGGAAAWVVARRRNADAQA